MRYEPHPYQMYCTERIVNDAALGLFLDPGMRKTSITLTAIDELKYNRWAIHRVLVIAPKKVAEATWQKEGKKWGHLHRLRFSTVLGSQQQRLRALATPADVYVINRDNVAWLVNYFKNAWPFDMVVLDESTSFKNGRSQRFKALKLVRNRINRLVELTGTPTSKRLIDLWAQVYLLDGGERLGKTIGQYRERFFDPDKRNRTTVFSYAPKEGSLEHIQQAISDICISLKAEDYLDLPKRIFHEVPVMLDASAAKAYKQLERELLLETDEGTITAGSSGVLTGKLLQLCNGAVYDNNKKVIEIHKCKIEAFLEIVEQLNGQPALVFYSFRHDLDRLLDALRPTGLRVRVYQGTADEDDWNAGKIDLLLAHPASCGYGLNLQDGGHHLIWFGLTWSFEQFEQAIRRLYRSGQLYPVIIHLLVVQGGMDEDVVAVLQQSRDTLAALMDALKVRIRKAKEGVA